MPPFVALPHVTIDVRMAGSSGIGTYITELVPRVVATLGDVRFTLLGDARELPRIVEESRRVRHVPFGAPIYSVREQLEYVAVIPRDTSLFWAPHYNIPLGRRAPLAVTVHDLNHLTTERSLAKRAYARQMFGVLRRRAAVVFCDSSYTATDLASRIGPPREVVVCPLGVGAPWTEPNDEPPPPDPFFLYVGNVKPHKNLPRLISAFESIAGSVPHRLVIAGRRDGMRTVDQRVVASGTSHARVEFTGHIAREELVRLVRRCDALVLPSLAEGFGLPPLEALACGRPVAVSNVASLPEVCGPLAEYFDPEEPASIAAALLRLSQRPPDGPAVIARRQEWSRKFDWAKTASITAQGLRRALSSTRRTS